MNNQELTMIGLLKELKQNYTTIAVKAEFETEASRLNEIMRLKNIANKIGLGITLKIGGAEAITDMFEAQDLGVDNLVAPMIESAYAMKKYLLAIKKYFPKDIRRTIKFGVNIETYQGYLNLNEILALPIIGTIDQITVGRVDLSGSLGLSREEINNDQVYKITEDICRQTKKRHLQTALGGGISIEAIPFMKRLITREFLDYFETRKIVFKAHKDFKIIREGIIRANRFELLWLSYKKRYYSRIFHEDDERIRMLEKRVV